MFQNYWKVLLRNLLKNKFFSAVNIFGLSVGMACCMLIARYVYTEMHYDRHHVHAENLYKVGTTFLRQQGEGLDRERITYNTPSPLAAALQREFGEIEKTTRVQEVFDREKSLIQSLQNGQVQKALNETKGFFADSSYFEMFQYDFLEGNPVKALNEPQTVVISEEIAHKLFGDQPAYGRMLRVSNNWFKTGELDFRITGVFRKPSAPSHLDGRFFMSLYSGELGDFVKTTTDLATNNMFATYLRLQPGTDGKALEAKLPAFTEKYASADLKARGFWKKQFLTPVADVHLSGVEAQGGNITYLYILSSIAIFTLLIACINFMNLSTARSAKRANEVGVRKSIGASKYQLVSQFLSESLVISMLSFLLALVLARLSLPAFNFVADRQLSLSVFENPYLFASFFGLALMTGLIAGLYPAFYLSSFRPMEVLKGKLANSLSVVFLRKGLVVFQFVISAGLILASLIINAQMKYLQSTDLGFTKDQQIVLPLLSKAAVAAYGPLKAALQSDSRIAKVGASQFYPGILNASDTGFFRDGQTIEQAVVTRRNWVDDGFLTTLGIQPVAGRLFSSEFPTDTAGKIILNEIAVKRLGFPSPQAAIGQQIMYTWKNELNKFEVIGVVRDFHFEDLHRAIEPYSFLLNAEPDHNYLIARANAGNMTALVGSIGKIWEQLVPGEPFEYTFLDDDFQKNYKNDRQIAGLVSIFTGIAILISCLGLFGLATFAAERRTKEIGIRKVLGASVAGITGLLARDFIKLVLIAIVIASPIAWWLMHKWLQDFAYRIDIQWWMFVAAGIIAVVIAFLTVGFQSMKAAMNNPVKSLHSD